MKDTLKTAEQLRIDEECGCVCHGTENNTQNFYWCGLCERKHLKDNRYKFYE